MKKFLTVYSVFLSVLLFSSENESTSHIEKIVLGSGCFWGAEKGYEALEGVLNAVSGYADGEGVDQHIEILLSFPINLTQIIMLRL